jgi:hypothetical protein
MRPRLLTALAAGALTLSLLGPVGAQADDPEVVPDGPSLPEQASETASEQATDALDQAQALFADRPSAAARQVQAEEEELDATMALNQLMRVYDDLSPSEQRQADALVARPTDPGGDVTSFGTFEYEDGEETPVCGEFICIHYASPGDIDAPPTTDDDPANGIPDAVDQALVTAEQVHATYVGAGYRRPEGDGTLGNEELAPGAPEDLVDIYLADTGGANTPIYGYCTADDLSEEPPYHRPAYCVIDEDFRTGQFGFKRTPLENQQVTIAHEYFHAVQYAYDAFEDGWIIEGTATWAEEQLFDGINDNRQYLEDSQLKQPRVPLDVYGDLYHYGTWIYFQYLTERWPATTGDMPTLVLDLWERMGERDVDPAMYSTQALQSVLAARGTSFTAVYGQFADGLRRPAKTFSEGGAPVYRPARPLKTWRLSTSKRTRGPFWVPIDHLTSVPLRYKPDSDLRKRDWRLRLKVDMPPAKTAPVARVARYLKNGKVSSSSIRLKANGFSTKVVGFSARNVKYVELVLVNASRRSNCWVGDLTFACQGDPRDDSKRTDFSASIFRR